MCGPVWPERQQTIWVLAQNPKFLPKKVQKSDSDIFWGFQPIFGILWIMTHIKGPSNRYGSPASLQTMHLRKNSPIFFEVAIFCGVEERFFNHQIVIRDEQTTLSDVNRSINTEYVQWSNYNMNSIQITSGIGFTA